MLWIDRKFVNRETFFHNGKPGLNLIRYKILNYLGVLCGPPGIHPASRLAY